MVVESTVSVAGTGVSATASPPGAAQTSEAPPGGRIAVDLDEARDFLRDDLPGYSADALESTPYALERRYVPTDKRLHDRLSVTAWRYRDPESARAGMRRLTSEPGVSRLQDADVAGLKAHAYDQAGERVLVLQDAQTVLFLRARAVGGDADALTTVLVEAAEVLLD